jgi:CRISPR-associated protein Csb2
LKELGRAPFRPLSIDWWETDLTGAQDLKVWAGTMESFGILGEQVATLDGHRWQLTPVGGTPLRVPTEGTLDVLMRKHEAFLNRLSSDGFRPVSPLKMFRVRGYRRDDEPLQRPYRVFELRRTDGSRRFRYPHSKLVHIAGMVRHLAFKAMNASPPSGLGNEWVENYVAGHATEASPEHRQLSYLPLPSVGHPHTDPGVWRIMIVAPVGDDAWLDHVARHLAGQMLEPLRGDEFAGREPPLLVPVRNKIARFTTPANTWASVTPVILPGHDDRKPEKGSKLIKKALAQSGIEQPCEFESSPFSRFPKALSAHKHDRDKRPSAYIRPDYLLTQTAVHLTLRFKDGLKIPGPLAIGAGKHQ